MWLFQCLHVRALLPVPSVSNRQEVFGGRCRNRTWTWTEAEVGRGFGGHQLLHEDVALILSLAASLLPLLLLAQSHVAVLRAIGRCSLVHHPSVPPILHRPNTSPPLCHIPPFPLCALRGRVTHPAGRNVPSPSPDRPVASWRFGSSLLYSTGPTHAADVTGPRPAGPNGSTYSHSSHLAPACIASAWSFIYLSIATAHAWVS
jgi:hypothetical protein